MDLGCGNGFRTHHLTSEGRRVVSNMDTTLSPQRPLFLDGSAPPVNGPFKSRSMTFVDLGCGNGFLTHLLTEEGHDGVGLDKFSRKIWVCGCP